MYENAHFSKVGQDSMDQEFYFQKIYFIQFFYRVLPSEWNEMNEAHVLGMLAQVSKLKNTVKIINNK